MMRKAFARYQKSLLGRNNSKFKRQHTDFFCGFYDKNKVPMFQEAGDVLFTAFSDRKLVIISAFHKHVIQHTSLTLRSLTKLLLPELLRVSIIKEGRKN